MSGCRRRTWTNGPAIASALFPIALLLGLAWTCGRALTGGRIGSPVRDGALPATGPRAG